ncbi:hypothetical protein P9Z84_29610 [Bacillus cereus]|uniref:hypothetical protein n=1 Tax=Bacillus thuringiensis TaxID=1428 RepID=UPI000BF3D0EB|nr:hypothetical protein [Bacillus thuringiensis]MEC3196809.1 hypothetical protein [Bacillus cereus]PEV88435.1 hypothetical protein CN442_20780 [Bacillus thuringiensis]PFK91009.1 hypothetical protein COJ04_21685 [Bacillus thuringiensis]
MFDSIKAVKEKVVNHFDKQEVKYTKKDAIIDTLVGVGAALAIVKLAYDGMYWQAGAFSAIVSAGNFAKGSLMGRALANRKDTNINVKVTKESPKVATIRNLINQENLEETFVVQFYTKNGKPIMRTAKPIYTYMNALVEGSEGLENIELAASFNIEKYYSRKGDE